ncbi:hypothetical protein C8R31_101562 [Nitrosospira sp. Nsp2]|uniref:four-helix bundle copper-binding protein n=1 Tax=Nitrosospira sp. Nsp2 TaxID=136548 RepID=UPI000D3FE04F|nr:four-helix bundle copper-binding protein [Nitrosospira sp. Nsp2]PTR17399.1 hypothetical protein C8R31_101562 [Nitrosospira sp. Nsp2]
MALSMNTSQNIDSCIDVCNSCHQICLQTAMTYCLESGGEHVEPEHLRLMMSCAEICQTASNFMLSGSRFSEQICRVCTEICDACAESCEKIGDMEECASACRDCAESCRNMGGDATS